MWKAERGRESDRVRGREQTQIYKQIYTVARAVQKDKFFGNVSRRYIVKY